MVKGSYPLPATQGGIVRKKLLVSAAVGIIASIALATPAQAHWDKPGQGKHHRTGTASVSAFHGVPNTPVDVYVDDKLVLDNFVPGTFAGPADLPAGTYTIAITGADAADASEPVIGPVDLTFERNRSYTIAAHLTPDGVPTASLFTNDQSRTSRHEGRLTVRHTAAAPAVDILAAGSAVIEGLTNPNEEVLELSAGVVPVAVALAGTTAPVIGPADVNVQARKNTIVYAWGSAAGGTLGVAVQTVDTRVRGWGHNDWRN